MCEVSTIKAKLAMADPAQREEALELLQASGPVVPLDAVSSLASDPESTVRNAFIETLHVYGDQAIMAYALSALSDSDEIVRISAAEGLAGCPRASEILADIEKHLDDPDPIVRRAVAEIFGAVGGPNHVTMLEGRLEQETSNQGRIGLLFALSRLGRMRECLPELLRLLQASDYHDRCATARVLADLFAGTQDAGVMARLQDALRVESTTAARSALEESLADIGAAS